jgi:hypothetical protein
MTEILDLSEQAPNLYKLKVPIYCDAGAIPYVKWRELNAALKKNKLSKKKFSQLFGSQTMSGNGPYYYDVEAVLERMINKKLTGTQLLWD